MRRMFSISGALVALLLLAAGAAAQTGAMQVLASGSVNEVLSVLLRQSDAESYNQLSRAYYAMEDWDNAVKYGERAVAARPDSSAYHMWLGRQYGEKAASSNPLAAATLARKTKAQFETAVKLDPANVEARSDLSEYYIEAPAIMGGGLDKARDQAAQVQKLDAAKAHWILARIAQEEKRYDDAEREFQAAVQSARYPAQYWTELGGFYRSRNRVNDMEKALQSALMVSGAPSSTYFDVAGELYTAGRNLPGAAQYLKKYLASGNLVEEAPAFRAHYLLGEIYQKLNNRQGAIAEYQASLSLASGFDRARKALDELQ